VWLGIYDEDGKTVLSEPTRIKTGILAEAQIIRSTGEAALQFSIDSDLQNARSAALRYVEHQNIFEGDTFSSYMVDLANKPGGFVRGALGGGSGGGDDNIFRNIPDLIDVD
jgi:hypothetical protein